MQLGPLRYFMTFQRGLEWSACFILYTDNFVYIYKCAFVICTVCIRDSHECLLPCQALSTQRWSTTCCSHCWGQRTAASSDTTCFTRCPTPPTRSSAALPTSPSSTLSSFWKSSFWWPGLITSNRRTSTRFCMVRAALHWAWKAQCLNAKCWT